MKVVIQQDGGQVNMLSHLAEPVFLDTKNYDKGQTFAPSIVNEVKKSGSRAILVAIKSGKAEIIANDPRYEVILNMGLATAPVLPTVEHIEQVLKSNKEDTPSFPPVAQDETSTEQTRPRYEIVYSEEALEKINPTKRLELITDDRPPIRPKKLEVTLPEPTVQKVAPEKILPKIETKDRVKYPLKRKDESNVLSAKDQINLIRESLRHVLNSQMQHGGLICGGSGLGKSFLVEDILENDFGLKRDLDFIVYKGSMTEAGLYKVLAKYHDKVIVLDDCDSVWGDKNAVNMLKGSLEATPPKVNKKGYVYRIEYALELRHEDGEVTESLFNAEFADADTEDMALRLFHLRIGNNLGKNEGFRIIKTIKEQAEFSVPLRFVSKVGGRGNSSPIKVSGKIFFVSNKNPEDINDAVKTRMEVCALDLSRDQVIEYIDAIKHHIMPHVTNSELKTEILNLYRDNPTLQLDLRTFAIAIDKAEKNPEKWREMLLFKK